jgi:hypothetical protein
METIRPKELLILFSAFFLLGVIAALDYFTGTEVQFYVFYYLPAGLCAWYFPVSYAFIISILGAFSMLWVGFLSGEIYHVESLRYVNFGLQVISGMLASWGTHSFRQTLIQQKVINEQLESKKRELERNIFELNKIRGGLQTICAWTRRIKDDGEWVTFEQFMLKHFDLQFTHGMSDEAFEQFKRDMGMLSQEPAVLSETAGLPGKSSKSLSETSEMPAAKRGKKTGRPASDRI